MFISTAYASASSIIKNDASLSDYFLSQFENLTPWKIIIGLIMGCIVGLVIAFVYKRCYRGVLYSPTFALTLMMLTLITTPVVMCIKSDIALSMGMVGALSIVRFRTAIKEPMDIAFLFWAIAAGIVLAAGMIPLAIVGSIIIGLLLILFCNRKSSQKPYIAVISCENGAAEEKVAAYLKANTDKTVVKSKSAQKGNIELSYEVTLKKDDTDFITKLSEMDGVSSAVLVSYNGDYMG